MTEPVYQVFVRDTRRSALILSAVAALLALAVSITGCEQHQCGDKKSRLIAAQNIELKQQLQGCRQQLAEQKQLAERYKQQKEDLRKRSDEASEKVMNFLFENFEAEKKQLEQENAELKEKIEMLEKQLKKDKSDPNT